MPASPARSAPPRARDALAAPRPAAPQAPATHTAIRSARSPSGSAVLARAVSGSDLGSGGGGSAGGGGGGGGGGGDSDQIYAEVMRRVREEQEQLGQLINHPF